MAIGFVACDADCDLGLEGLDDALQNTEFAIMSKSYNFDSTYLIIEWCIVWAVCAS